MFHHIVITRKKKRCSQTNLNNSNRIRIFIFMNIIGKENPKNKKQKTFEFLGMIFKQVKTSTAKFETRI